MKNIIKSLGFIFFLFAFSSCDSYLDRQPDDALTIDMVFEKRATTWNYLVNVYRHLVYAPKVSHPIPTA